MSCHCRQQHDACMRVKVILPRVILQHLSCVLDTIILNADRTTQMASNSVAHSARKSLAMGPTVRTLLHHYQIDPSKVNSSGPHKTILKHDVLSYINQNHLAPASSNQQRAANGDAKPSPKKFVPKLDTSGYQPKSGPEGFSKIARKLLDM